MIRFQHPEFFLLLVLLPLAALLFFYALNQKKKTAKRIADPGLLHFLLKDFRPYIFSLKFFLLIISLGLLIMAAVNPRKTTGTMKISRNGVDVMIVLDVSKSMLAQDISPSRLERAKQFCARLVDKLSNDRMGMVVFAGRAYLQMPLTSDHTAAKMYINAADPGQIPTQGTVIASALQMAASGFNAQEKKYKAIILISDGEDHDEDALKTARELSNQGIVIYTVGIGSPLGSIIPDENTGQPKQDNAGNVVVSKLNEKELRDIAQAGNGRYCLFENADATVEPIVSDISKMDQRTVTDDAYTHFASLAIYFLAAALLLLLIEFFMKENRRLRRKQVTHLIMWGSLLCFGFTQATAQQGKKWVKEGNEQYEKKDYTKASALYKKALDENPNLPEAAFNKGNADYRAKKTDESVADYEEAIKLLNNPTQKSNAYFNKGVVLQNSKKLPECIEAYKNALLLDPLNDDARQNLQKALQDQNQQKEQAQNNKPQQNKQQTPPRQKPSQMKKQDALDKLKALEQHEKDLQDKLHKSNPATINRPEKDW